MSRRARTRRDKRAPQPDFDDDTTAAYGRTRLDRFYGYFGQLSCINRTSAAWPAACPAMS